MAISIKAHSQVLKMAKNNNDKKNTDKNGNKSKVRKYRINNTRRVKNAIINFEANFFFVYSQTKSPKNITIKTALISVLLEP
jgi:hypothetical protein